MTPVELAGLCVKAFSAGRESVSLTVPARGLPTRFPRIELLCVNERSGSETWSCEPLSVVTYLAKAGLILLAMRGNHVLIGDAGVLHVDIKPWKLAIEAAEKEVATRGL